MPRIISANLIINEIMAAPIADESLNEWVELYNDGPEEINVSNFAIGDDSDNDTLSGGLYYGLGTIIPPYGYAIITDEMTRVYDNFNFSPFAVKLYVDDAAIGNGLRDSGETIYLYDLNGNLLDSVTYNETKKGKSFAFFNNSWYEADVTPGYNNNGSFTLKEETNDCDWKIEILLNKTIFENSDEFEWRMRAIKLSGVSTKITGIARIENLSGDIVKSYNPWTDDSVSSQRTSSKYSPSLDEGNIYLITAEIVVGCNDANLDNNVAQKAIIIEKPYYGGSSTSSDQKINSSSIEIEEILDLGDDSKAEFGQSIRVKLNIYKGNTNKYVITSWIEDNSEKISIPSKLNIYGKFTDSKFALPIQLKPNCDLKYEDGKYKVKVEGLDAYAEKEIRVDGINDKLCGNKETGEETGSGKVYYELVDWPINIENDKEFEIKVEIDNDDKKDHMFNVWSYVYRGPKSYSGEREENLKSVKIDKEDSEEVTLRNAVSDAEPGEYNLMVKILKDNQKTEKKMSKKIKVIGQTKEIEQNVKSSSKELTKKESSVYLKGEDNEAYSTILESTKQPRIVYESTTLKAQKLVVWFFVGLLVVIVCVLFSRR